MFYILSAYVAAAKEIKKTKKSVSIAFINHHYLIKPNQLEKQMTNDKPII